MAEGLRNLDHLYVIGRAANEDFHRRGGPNPKVRPVERRAHGMALRGELDQVLAEDAMLRRQLVLQP